MKARIAAMCCTHGRYSCLQRSVRNFLDQDYDGYHLLFICNTGRDYVLSPELYPSNLPDNKQIMIWSPSNQSTEFNSVGAKYNQALKELLNSTSRTGIDIVTSWDDDDIFLPNHLSEGNRGINRAWEKGMKAYKPRQSYYRYSENGETKIQLVENAMEPSIFVDINYLKGIGYAPVSIKYHQQWLDPLSKDKKILVDNGGTPTLVYNWGSEIPVYKMSGRGIDNPMNFNEHKKSSIDFGPREIVPLESAQNYYDEVKALTKS